MSVNLTFAMLPRVKERHDNNQAERLTELNINKIRVDSLNTCTLPVLVPLTRDKKRIIEPNSRYSSHPVDYCSIASLLHPLSGTPDLQT